MASMTASGSIFREDLGENASAANAIALFSVRQRTSNHYATSRRMRQHRDKVDMAKMVARMPWTSGFAGDSANRKADVQVAAITAEAKAGNAGRVGAGAG